MLLAASSYSRRRFAAGGQRVRGRVHLTQTLLSLRLAMLGMTLQDGMKPKP